MPILSTFADIHNSVLEKAQISANSVSASNFVNRMINERYEDVVGRYCYRWLESSSSTVVPKVYKAGSVTVANGAATVVGSATVSFTSSMVGRVIYFDTVNARYEIASRVSATRVLLTASYRGTAISAGAYRVYRDTYKTAIDCEDVIDVFPPGRNPYGSKSLKTFTSRQMLDAQLGRPTLEDFAHFWSHGQTTTSGTRRLIIWPGAHSDQDYRLNYYYNRKVTALTASSQTPIIPERYRSVLMWGALSDVLFREGQDQKAARAEAKFQEKLEELRRDTENTDRRTRLRVAWNFSRERLPSPARYDLGTAWDDDTWRND